MICVDCANGADIATAFTAVGLRRRIPPDVAAIVEANHDVCLLRNLDREVGQLADCTCQHAVTTPTSATPRS